ncbi:MAG TPA: hypothetical protein VGC35_05780 [Allosphingosinicella sp.]|jgi:hypothetical protein
MSESAEPISFDELSAKSSRQQMLSNVGRADLSVSRNDFHLFESTRPDASSDLFFKFRVTNDLPLEIAPVFGLQTDDTINGFGSDLAKAIMNLNPGRETVTRYHQAVGAAAIEAVEEQRGSGDDIKLAGVGLKYTCAFYLAHSNWREAVNFVLATIDLDITGPNGKPDRTQIVVQEPEEVAEEIEARLPR